MKQKPAVLGVVAPPASPTKAGAFWVAAIVSVPVGIVLIGIEVIVRAVF